MDGARRTFSVRLAENIVLPRDTLGEGLTVLKTRYEFESGWTTSAVEGSTASSEELKNTLKDLSLEKRDGKEGRR